MSKRMTMGSGALLCLAVLLLPGRAIGQDKAQAAEHMYAQAIALSAQASVMSAQAMNAATQYEDLTLSCHGWVRSRLAL